jgi:predicted enzyme related to lactoylglutathione lyase/DNA-binding CsgD family transcriptional regulator
MAGRGRPRHPDVLTPAEWRVVDALRHGMPERVIADRHGISRDAVRSHARHARDKLGLADRRALRWWPGVPADSAVRARGSGMGELALGPIGQVARRVGDLAAAVAFYRDTLGVTHLYTYGDLAFFDCAGVRLFLNAGEGTAPRDQQLIYFRVDDIHAAQRELTGRGVQFTGAPHMIFKHADGVEEWMTFFTDPDGVPLALMAQVAPEG